MAFITETIKENDLYPSRNLPNPSLQKRTDPVLWGGSNNKGPLSKDQLVEFENNGFLYFKGFFNSEDVNEYLMEFDRLKNVHAVKEAPEIIREPSSLDVRSIFNIHRLSPLIKNLSQNPRVAGMAQQILESNVYIHQSRINFKPGYYGKEFYWHSDFETWHVEDGMPRMRAVSCAISLTDNNEFNGPLMFIPGSHKTYVACPGETPEEHYKKSLRKQEYGVPDKSSLEKLVRESSIVSPKGPAGSLLLFDSNIMHGSNSNISPFPRSNIFFCFNSIENQLDEPFGGMKPRPEFIATRQI